MRDLQVSSNRVCREETNRGSLKYSSDRATGATTITAAAGHTVADTNRVFVHREKVEACFSLGGLCRPSYVWRRHCVLPVYDSDRRKRTEEIAGSEGVFLFESVVCSIACVHTKVAVVAIFIISFSIHLWQVHNIYTEALHCIHVCAIITFLCSHL